MALYEYQCEKCDVVFEALSSLKDRKTKQICPNCSGKGIFIISAPFLKAYIESDKWIKNRESHMKQERKNMKDHGTYK